jgi:pantetheine-phosphate adenylyltransferase
MMESKKKKCAVILPGSYDPPTLGHREMIRLAAEEYEEVYAVAFINPEKKYTFTPSQRVAMLMLTTDDLPNVLVSYSTGLVIDYMREHGIERIIKGYRNDTDLAYEKKMAEWNLTHGGYQTDLVKSPERFAEISSTLAREKIDLGEDLSGILHPSVIEYLRQGEKKS